jgi:hypothetical protein
MVSTRKEGPVMVRFDHRLRPLQPLLRREQGAAQLALHGGVDEPIDERHENGMLLRGGHERQCHAAQPPHSHRLHRVQLHESNTGPSERGTGRGPVFGWRSCLGRIEAVEGAQ